MNHTTSAVRRAQPSEMLSVPHQGTRSKPSTAHMGERETPQLRSETHFFFSTIENFPLLFLETAEEDDVSSSGIQFIHKTKKINK